MIWTDNMLIPTGGDVFTASTFMDFVYDPKIAAQIEAYVNYICPVEGAKDEMLKIDPRSRTTISSSPTRRRSRRSRSSTRKRPTTGNTRSSSRRSSAPRMLRREAGASATDERVAVSVFHRHRWLTPYLLLAPGLAFLAFFFLIPTYYLGNTSLQSGDLFDGYVFTWAWENYRNAISSYDAPVHSLARVRGRRNRGRVPDQLPARVLDRVSRGAVEEPAPAPRSSLPSSSRT